MQRAFLALTLLLSGCATSSYGRGCRDALDAAFTGPWTDWHDPFCDDLEKKYNEEQRQQQLQMRELRESRP